MGVKDGFAPIMKPGAYSNEARFLEPTDENTLTWGGSDTLVAPAGTAEVVFTTQQLIHVGRKRPTTFSVAVTLLLMGGNWTGEGPLLLQVVYTIGVGQVKTPFVRNLPVATPSNGLAAINDVFELPCTAMQVRAQLVTSALINAGAHSALVTALAAPVYA
jgi:hypothetical protein